MTADKDWQNAFDSLRDNIEDIKETIRVDVKEPLKELTKVISSLAVQEEKIDSINKRLTVTERSLKEVWCSYYELREDYSKRDATPVHKTGGMDESQSFFIRRSGYHCLLS